MNNDQFLEQALLEDKVRPMPGHVFCMKQTKGQVLNVDGLGAINVSEIRSSGLVLPSTETKDTEMVKAMLVTVVAMGAEPYAWETRIPKSKRKEKHATTWAEQQIEIGTVLSLRPIAGVNQTKDSPFLDVRYDEISCIGQFDPCAPAMLPAPGWVLVRLVEVEKQDHAGLVIQDGLEEILQQGFMYYGDVIGLPRGSDPEKVGFSVGDRICFPAHTGVGAIEFIEFDGGLRALPIHDVLGKVEEPDDDEEPDDYGPEYDFDVHDGT